jgi:hypothetical protein
VAAADKGTTGDMALINVLIRTNDMPGALKAVDNLAAKLPNDALPDQLRGRIALQTKDTAAARKHFEAGLAKNADYLPALAGLAALDLADKQPAAAKTRFEAALQRNPQNTGARLALAELTARSGGKPEEGLWLTDAVAADPTDATARMLLVDHHLGNNATKARWTRPRPAWWPCPQPELWTGWVRAQRRQQRPAGGEHLHCWRGGAVSALPCCAGRRPQRRRQPSGAAAAVRHAAGSHTRPAAVQQAQVLWPCKRQARPGPGRGPQGADHGRRRPWASAWKATSSCAAGTGRHCRRAAQGGGARPRATRRSTMPPCGRRQGRRAEPGRKSGASSPTTWASCCTWATGPWPAARRPMPRRCTAR